MRPTVGYQAGAPSGQGPEQYHEQDREEFYASTHLQAIEFEVTRQVVSVLVGDSTTPQGQGRSPRLGLQSRHQLFPQVLRLVKAYAVTKVDLRASDPRELGHERYVKPMVERLVAAIEPDALQGEPPLLPILNRYQPYGTTAGVDFKTTKPCHATERSHVNQIAADTATWEQSAVFRLEQARETVTFYARNEGLGFEIPYEHLGVSHAYEPDYLVRMTNGTTPILEIKGREKAEEPAKHQAAKRWVAAVNNWGRSGRWAFHVCRDPQMLGRELRYLFFDERNAAD